MRKIICLFLTLLASQLLFSQHVEKLDYCYCKDKIDTISPLLQGNFERKFRDKIIEKGAFNNGVKNGEWTTYNRKGKLIRKLNYSNGLLDGTVELYFGNKKPKLIGQFDKGKKTGKWTYFSPKGKIWVQGNYEFNQPIDTWIINNNNGKGILTMYDYNSKKYIKKEDALIHKIDDVIKNDNTNEWYILRTYFEEYSSESEPLGGYTFANAMFIELVEVPENIWDTNVDRTYKIQYTLNEKSELSFESELYSDKLKQSFIMFNFKIMTNPESNILIVNHSDLQSKLLDYKINEALNLMPPWVHSKGSKFDVYLRYVVNKDLF